MHRHSFLHELDFNAIPNREQFIERLKATEKGLTAAVQHRDAPKENPRNVANPFGGKAGPDTAGCENTNGPEGPFQPQGGDSSSDDSDGSENSEVEESIANTGILPRAVDQDPAMSFLTLWDGYVSFTHRRDCHALTPVTFAGFRILCFLAKRCVLSPESMAASIAVPAVVLDSLLSIWGHSHLTCPCFFLCGFGCS